MRDQDVQREPAWSEDGKRIAFAADRGEGFDIYAVSSRGGSPERITSLPGDSRAPSWTPDGRIVFAHRDPGASQWDLYVVDADAGDDARVPVRLTQTPDNEILGHYDARPGATTATDANYWHHSIEAWKVRDRISRVADPAHWAISYEQHLQRDHAGDLFRRIRPNAASRTRMTRRMRRRAPNASAVARARSSSPMRTAT